MFHKRRAVLLFAIAAASLTRVFAQATSSDTAPPPSPTPPAESAASSASSALEGPRQGDRWTYELKDDITGDITQFATTTVVEISEKEIVTRASLRGQQGFQTIVFNHNWARIDDMCGNPRQMTAWEFQPRLKWARNGAPTSPPPI
jgi:hypothetical protein